MNGHLTDWAQALRELLFPRCRCPFCDQPLPPGAGEICPACQRAVADSCQGWRPCQRCATFIPAGLSNCVNCHALKGENWLDQSRAAGPYEGILKENIRKFKYHHGVWLDKPLGQMMLAAVKEADYPGLDMVVPVPLHPVRLAERGYNQAELLARVIARGLGLPMNCRALIRQLNTPSQTNLHRQDRLANLDDAFALTRNDEIYQKRILLVDDIFTTGATGNSCAKTLKNGGGAAVYFVACAAGKQQNLAN